MVDERNDVPNVPEEDLENAVNSMDEPEQPILTIPKENSWISDETKEKWRKRWQKAKNWGNKDVNVNPFRGSKKHIDDAINGAKKKAKTAGFAVGAGLYSMKDGIADAYGNLKQSPKAKKALIGVGIIGALGLGIVGTGYLMRTNKSTPDELKKPAVVAKAPKYVAPVATTTTGTAYNTTTQATSTQPSVTETATPGVSGLTATTLDYALGTPVSAPTVTNTTDSTATFDTVPKPILGMPMTEAPSTPVVEQPTPAHTIDNTVTPPVVTSAPDVPAPIKVDSVADTFGDSTPLGFTPAMFKTELYEGKERRLNNPAFIVKEAGKEDRVVEISTNQYGLARKQPRYTLENVFKDYTVKTGGVAATPFNGTSSAYEVLDVALSNTQSVELKVPEDKYGRQISVSLSPTFNGQEVRSTVKTTTITSEELRALQEKVKDGKLMLVYDVAARNENGEIIQSYKAPIVISFNGEATPATTYGRVTPAKTGRTETPKQAVVESTVSETLEQTIDYEQPDPQPAQPVVAIATQNNYNGAESTPSTVTIQSDGTTTTVIKDGQVVEPNTALTEKQNAALEYLRNSRALVDQRIISSNVTPSIEDRIDVVEQDFETLLQNGETPCTQKAYSNGRVDTNVFEKCMNEKLDGIVAENQETADYNNRKQELVWLDKQLYAIANDLKNDAEKLENGYMKECYEAKRGEGKYKDLNKQNEKLKDCDNIAMDMMQRVLTATSKGAILENKLEEFKRLYGEPDFPLEMPSLDFEIPNAKNDYNASTEVVIDQ